MLNFFASLIVTSLLTLFLLSFIVFSTIHLAPGDPARLMLPMEADEEDILEMRKALGLDKPFVVQYLIWAKNAIRLDFGKSIQMKYSSSRIFLQRIPATLELTLGGIFLSIFFAVPIGIFAALKRNSFLDFLISFISLFGLSTPRFWFGIILILVFSLGLGWFPPFGREVGLFTGIASIFHGELSPLYHAVKHLALPSITLATWFFAVFLRYTKASVLEEFNKLYVKTARQKGISEWRVMLAHVIRNALIPIVTVIGVQISILFGGAVVTEIVFAWPGVGQLLIQALFARDYPVIQASLFMIGSMIVVISILLDIIYVTIDPRIIYGTNNL
jgi:ABC-type dipeptide/oligopeptide/nickel transport system permease component